MKYRQLPILLLLAITAALPACKKAETTRVQGYVEGEFVHEIGRAHV